MMMVLELFGVGRPFFLCAVWEMFSWGSFGGVPPRLGVFLGCESVARQCLPRGVCNVEEH